MPSSQLLICPHCQKQLNVQGASAGRQVRCPQCKGFIRVPDAESAPDPLWRLRTETGKVYGPVPRAELVQWAREGRISASCQASPSDSNHWLPVTSVLTEVVWPATAAAPPNPQPAVPQPVYLVQPRTSDRSRLVAGLLGLLLQFVEINAAHQLYTGHIGLGILMMITCGGCGIWQLIDTILVFAGSVRDVDGLPLAP